MKRHFKRYIIQYTFALPLISYATVCDHVNLWIKFISAPMDVIQYSRTVLDEQLKFREDIAVTVIIFGTP